MQDQFDVDLEDHDLRDEIELLTQLIVAAMPFDHHLTTSQIDAALGLDPSPVLDTGLVPAPRRALEAP